jgi:type IV pilus assembly protein PilW
MSTTMAISIKHSQPAAGGFAPGTKGFSLLELMVAITLGLLLSIGIISLFGSTSRTNKLQDALAHLQENGRFAVVRMDTDMRMLGGQYCTNKTGSSVTGGGAPMWPGRAPYIFSATLSNPNLPSPGLPDNGGNSINPATGALLAANATAAYLLSPRYMVQGYTCASGTCTPAVPTSIPDAAVQVDKRVPNSDVLTVRYQRGTGWPIAITTPAPTCNTGTTFNIVPATGDDPVNFSAGDLALVSDCQNVSVIPTSAVGGNTLTVGTILGGSTPICVNPGDHDMRVFNFSKDFVTVTYFLMFKEDGNPDGKPNSAGAKRLIPTLMRQENESGAAVPVTPPPVEIVRGVDRLDFRFLVQDDAASMHFLTAAEVTDRKGGAINCPPKPAGIYPDPTSTTQEPGCLWRAVTGVETHLLLNTVDDVTGGLDPTSLSYTYSVDPSSPRSDLPSGLQPGSMLRREFISLVSPRNYHP